MKKIFILIFCLFTFNNSAIAKETTFNKELFNKAQVRWQSCNSQFLG